MYPKHQILTFCSGAFVLLQWVKERWSCLTGAFGGISLTDGLQGGSHHPASRPSFCFYSPTSAQGPAEEVRAKVCISLPVGGSRWLKLSSALKHSCRSCLRDHGLTSNRSVAHGCSEQKVQSSSPHITEFSLKVFMLLCSHIKQS